VLYCGINQCFTRAPRGFTSRPGNRFWPTLYRAGFTDRQLFPSDAPALGQHGFGLANLIGRATARADELSAAELMTSARRLEAKIRCYRPRFVALLGISVYRVALAKPKALLGEQTEALGSAMFWVLPSPSGPNAHCLPNALAHTYAQLRRAVNGLRMMLPVNT
jgi:double-stranded uracil-DNA glycosylase